MRIFTDLCQRNLNAEQVVNGIIDPINDEQQLLSGTGCFFRESWILPCARLGVGRNLMGSELSYINAGAIVFKFINLDTAITLDAVSISGSNLKRGINIHLAVQFYY